MRDSRFQPLKEVELSFKFGLDRFRLFISFFGLNSCTFAAPLHFIYILPVLHGRPIREAQEGCIEFSVVLEGGPALFIPPGIWG